MTTNSLVLWLATHHRVLDVNVDVYYRHEGLHLIQKQIPKPPGPLINNQFNISPGTKQYIDLAI